MRTLFAAVVACLAIGGLSHAGESQAAIRKTFNIPAQGLGPALRTLSREEGVHVVFMLEDVERLSTEGIRGEMTLDEALDQLLRGTGLTYEYADKETVTIVPLAMQPAQREGSAALRTTSGSSGRLRFAQADSSAGAAQRSGEQVGNDAEAAGKSVYAVEEEIIVTAKVNFVANDAFGATKMGLSIKDTPFSVLPLTHDLLEMASVKIKSDMAKLDPSGGGDGRDGGSSNFWSRGFLAEERIDGFRSSFFGINNDLSSYERAEIIKGGVSTLYGQASPGGVINYVSKIPETTAAARFKAEVGDDNYQRLEADLTGPMFGSEQWSYRFVAMGQQDDTFRDHSQDDRISVVPSVMYRGENSSFILRARYQKAEPSYSTTEASFQLDRPLPAGMTWQTALATGAVRLRPLDDVFDDVPRSRWLAPIGAVRESEVSLLQAQHEYALPSGWKIRTNAQYAKVEFDRSTVTVLGPWDVNGNLLQRETEQSELSDTRIASAEVNLFGSFELLGREHTLFFGVDYAAQRGLFSSLPRAAADENLGPQNTVFNLYNPNYAAAERLVTLSAAQRNAFLPFRQDLTYFGVTTQVMLRPIDRLGILLGGRYNSDTTGSASAGAQERKAALRVAGDLDTTSARTVFNRLSKQAGVTYEITDQINAYASASESFQPSSARSFVAGSTTGKPIEPPQADTYEIGFKAQFDGPWAFTLTGFEIEQDAVVADPDHATYSILIPGWRNRGVEFAVQGKFFESLSVFAGIAHQDAEYTREPFKGQRVAYAPDLGITLFGTYELLSGNLRGLGFGAGVVHKRGRKHSATDVRIPSTGELFVVDAGNYTNMDARIFYNRDRWGVYGSVTNLTDERHLEPGFISLAGGGWVNPGRQFRIGANFEF